MLNINAHIERELINRYGGSERKSTVILDDGNKYLLKQPDPVREKNRNVSYINNAISEYLGCHIVDMMGLNVQDTILGEYTNSSGKTSVACLCKDFRPNGFELIELENAALSSNYSVDHHKATFSNIERISVELGIHDDFMDYYYCLFVADAFIGNPDRHNGNVGILQNDAGEMMLAPIYDCGSSLEPLADMNGTGEADVVSYALNGYSAICDEDGHRLHYGDFLATTDNPGIIGAMLVFVPNIDLKQIFEFIDEMEAIGENQKAFYKTFLQTKYERILLPAIEAHLEVEAEIPEMDWYSVYKKYIRPISNFHCFEVNSMDICGKNLAIMKVCNKYALTLNEYGDCNGIIRIANKESETKKAVQQFLNLGVDIGKFMGSNMDTPADLDDLSL